VIEACKALGHVVEVPDQGANVIEALVLLARTSLRDLKSGEFQRVRLSWSDRDQAAAGMAPPA
jgi:hypothetical protein